MFLIENDFNMIRHITISFHLSRVFNVKRKSFYNFFLKVSYEKIFFRIFEHLYGVDHGVIRQINTIMTIIVLQGNIPVKQW